MPRPATSISTTTRGRSSGTSSSCRRVYSGEAEIQRLLANGSDAITGVTFDGYSYNYELESGKPVLLQNVTRGETVSIGSHGKMSIEVPRSSAAIVRFSKGASGYS